VLFGTTSPFIPQGVKGSQGVFSREAEKFSRTVVTVDLKKDFRPGKKI
jgi:hypothetical protein